ncbi:MAG: aminoacetone oxidase family FAD-binding enzyme, partial [Candidatus Melainabacteria bacterium HGW-Melainabacteria-1]
MPVSNVIVIGGGAAGLSAAVAAARIGAHVIVLEAGPRVGRKIL